MKERLMSPGTKNFLVGVAIMVTVVVFAEWITRNDSSANQIDCNATQNYAQGC